MTLSGWQKTTVKEQVYNLLKQNILTQKYEMGERLNIGNLSQQLGVSNSPIREAINMLVTEGLVTVSPNSTVSVVSLTMQDMYELSQMICFLQIGAYEYCVRQEITQKLLTPMKRILDRQHDLMAKGELYEFVQAANSFDRCIIEGTGNSRLLGNFDNVFALFTLAALYDYQHRDTDWRMNTAEHEQIYEAVLQQRHRQVVELIDHHYSKPEWADKW